MERKHVIDSLEKAHNAMEAAATRLAVYGVYRVEEPHNKDVADRARELAGAAKMLLGWIEEMP